MAISAFLLPKCLEGPGKNGCCRGERLGSLIMLTFWWGKKSLEKEGSRARSEFEGETVEMDGLIGSVTLDLEPWEEA